MSRAQADDSLVADVASELEERLSLEAGGSASVECRCEAVGVDSENRYLECTYEVREGAAGGGGGRNNMVNGAKESPRLSSLRRNNKKKQGVVAVKVP